MTRGESSSRWQRPVSSVAFNGSTLERRSFVWALPCAPCGCLCAWCPVSSDQQFYGAGFCSSIGDSTHAKERYLTLVPTPFFAALRSAESYTKFLPSCRTLSSRKNKKTLRRLHAELVMVSNVLPLSLLRLAILTFAHGTPTIFKLRSGKVRKWPVHRNFLPPLSQARKNLANLRGVVGTFPII